MLRMFFAPIVLRFHTTDDLLDALYIVERSYTNPKSSIPKAVLERAMCLISRELLRRKVIFWT